MNIFDFIIYQQSAYPTECALILLALVGVFGWSSIAFWITAILHGFPTQKIIYSKTDAQNVPSRQYFIEGTLKDEMVITDRNRRRLDKGMRNLTKLVKKYPKETILVILICSLGMWLL